MHAHSKSPIFPVAQPENRATRRLQSKNGWGRITQDHHARGRCNGRRAHNQITTSARPCGVRLTMRARGASEVDEVESARREDHERLECGSASADSNQEPSSSAPRTL